MPKSVLTRKRSLIARFAILAMIFSLMAVALPASAHSVAIDTTGPCPAATPSAGFTDIGAFDATTQLAINCLFAFGITTGTSATTYSPNDTITRWQMALFLVRQLADHGVAIPAATNQGYIDIGGHAAATQDAINQITQLGISLGTSSNTFSPDDGVTRWQMALFIYRTGQDVGVTFVNNAAHNEFIDIATLSAEAQTAINALADTEADPAGHIALGTGTSLFSPNLVLVRWQMALFLTRLLAADDVAAPSGTLVVVTPSAQATQATGTARAYTATIKNSDGTNYSGQVIIRLRDANSDGTVGTTASTGALIDSVDGAAIAPVVSTTAFAGVDGVVNFTVRHSPTTAAGDAVPQVIRDSDTDGVVDTGEIIGSGGAVFFTFIPAELAAAPAPGGTIALDVCSTDKADDFFVVDSTDGDCAAIATAARVEYDDNDIYVGDALTYADFESALSVGDTVTANPYESSDAAQSTFTLTDGTAPLTVDAPTTPVDAATVTLTGSGNPGWEVRVYRDQPVVNTYSGAVDPEVTSAAAVVDPDGSWSATVPLLQGTTNDFIVVQRSAGSSATGAPVGGATIADPNVEDVPTITESATAGATLTSTTASNGGASTLGVLDPGDQIVITFSESIINVGAGDTITVVDTDGSEGTLTNGTNATFTAAGAVLTIDVTAVVSAPGGTTGGIQPSASVSALTGFTDDDGETINVLGSGAGRTFAGF